jgi:tetratricopeptide (TPR) repeat protein
MDNFERLFNDKRKNFSDKNSSSPSLLDMQNMVNSEWMKLLIMGVNYYQDKNYPSAIIYLNKAIELEKNNQHLYYVRASIKEDSGDPNGAISDYKEGLNIAGSDWYATYNQIAINFLNSRNFEKALLAFDIAAALKEEVTNRGLDESVNPYVVDGVVVKVDFERIYTNRAIAKLNLRDFQGCLDDCNKAIKANPSYSHSYLIAGKLLAIVGQKNQSLDALRKAQELGNPSAANLMQQLHGI